MPQSRPFQDSVKQHVLEVRERLLCVEDGLLLGNGDLSVSVYQTADCILWRLGKGDVWDRRLDLSDDPRPLAVEELAYGLQVEGWKSTPGGLPEAVRGSANPQRMREVFENSAPGYRKRPYPCPKPVGELALQLPPDRRPMAIVQRLIIEEARLEITCTWPEAVQLHLVCFVPPTPNALVLHWWMEHWNRDTLMGNKVPPVWFKLYRWADPPIREYVARFHGQFRNGVAAFEADDKLDPKPLDPPQVLQDEGLSVIEQAFPPDPLFPQGFCYRLVPHAPVARIQPMDMTPTGEARLHILPPVEATEGWLTVHVPACSDALGLQGECQRVRSLLATDPSGTLTGWQVQTAEQAQAFWSRSAITVADTFVENVWYQTLHAHRCTCRADTVPPGLFLPSTVGDYSHWHGDYHTNYNLQSPFWGDYAANHFDLGDAYFRALDFFLPIGKKIAYDYYRCRGTFIQLVGFPVKAMDDPFGHAPLGRMVYMTGWASNQYWWRYLYSRDKGWLRREGYPVIRDCALFLTDFLRQGADGVYHAFPSNQGEDPYTGDPADCTDQPQVLNHIRYTLRAAIAASRELDMDESLRTEWEERIKHLSPVGDTVYLAGLARWWAESNPPEFVPWPPFQAKGSSAPAPEDMLSGKDPFLMTWYPSVTPWFVLSMLHNGQFSPERDFPNLRRLLERWRHPNGVMGGMAIANYGHCGLWTESLGISAPLQEMMLQSWGGILRFFPAWPRDLPARFRDLRAEGAFLVSASWSDGAVQSVRIYSEVGGSCRFICPWRDGCLVQDPQGQPMTLVHEPEGVLHFATMAGHTYELFRTDT